MKKRHLTLVHSITEQELKTRNSLSNETPKINENRDFLILIMLTLSAMAISLLDIYSKELNSKFFLVLLTGIIIGIGLYQTSISFLSKFLSKSKINNVNEQNQKLKLVK